jgi:hypothetical protein
LRFRSDAGRALVVGELAKVPEAAGAVALRIVVTGVRVTASPPGHVVRPRESGPVPDEPRHEDGHGRHEQFQTEDRNPCRPGRDGTDQDRD